MADNIGAPPRLPDGTEGTSTIILTLKDNQNDSKKSLITYYGCVIPYNEMMKNFLNLTTNKGYKFFIYFCCFEQDWLDRLLEYELRIHRFTKPEEDKICTQKGIVVVKGCHVFVPATDLILQTRDFLKFINKYGKKLIRDHKIQSNRPDRPHDSYKGISAAIENELVKFLEISLSTNSSRLVLRDELFNTLVDGPLLCNDKVVGWCTKDPDGSKISVHMIGTQGTTVIWKTSSLDQSDGRTGSLPPSPSNANHQATVDAHNDENAQLRPPTQESPARYQHDPTNANQPPATVDESPQIPQPTQDSIVVLKATTFLQSSESHINDGNNTEDDDDGAGCKSTKMDNNDLDATNSIKSKLQVSLPEVDANNDTKGHSIAPGDEWDAESQSSNRPTERSLSYDSESNPELPSIIPVTDEQSLASLVPLEEEKGTQSVEEQGTANPQQPNQPPQLLQLQEHQQVQQPDTSPVKSEDECFPERLKKVEFNALYESNHSVVQDLGLYLNKKSETQQNVTALADELNAHSIIKAKCNTNYNHSPASDLIKLPEMSMKKIQDLIDKLTEIQRKGLADLIEKEFPDEKERQSCQVEVLQLLKHQHLFDHLTSKLDERTTPFNWRCLGKKCGIEDNQLDLIEKGTNPAERFLVEYAYSALPSEQLQLSKLLSHMTELGREKEMEKLFKTCTIKKKTSKGECIQEGLTEDDHSESMRDVFAPQTKNLESLCQLLNKQNCKGWQYLAKLWDLEVFKYYHYIPDINANATEILLEWLRMQKPEYTVFELYKCLKKIGREDVCRILMKKLLESETKIMMNQSSRTK